ncbi:MAG: ABC transporter permease, partial [Alphaproteobacteria bacterium]|nr:ABC transporter permease [Alphaproteobacteria bacterium]
MIRFVLPRLFQAVLTVFGVLTAAFFLVRLSGDPSALLLGEQASQTEIAQLRAALGLDQPLWVQYAIFLGNAFQGDFGNSLRHHTSALRLVLERLPATLELALTAFALGIAMAFVLGLAMRLSQSKTLRAVLYWLAFVRQAIPVFWFGLLMILLFSVTLRWLPSLGRGGIEHLILPAITLAT